MTTAAQEIEKEQVEIFTDGACYGNPGPGGWGAQIRFGKNVKEIYGGEKDTTNNRMELLAAIKGLEELKKSSKIIIYLFYQTHIARHDSITNFIFRKSF